jgi:hypothetical protein
MRGGAHDPLPITELEGKFIDNAKFGGWDAALAKRFLELTQSLFGARNLSSLVEFRR